MLQEVLPKVNILIESLFPDLLLPLAENGLAEPNIGAVLNPTSIVPQQATGYFGLALQLRDDILEHHSDAVPYLLGLDALELGGQFGQQGRQSQRIDLTMDSIIGTWLSWR